LEARDEVRRQLPLTVEALTRRWDEVRAVAFVLLGRGRLDGSQIRELTEAV
jgi:hypothetical protein